ncbi:MAG: hypothetical protein HY611_08765, partial [Elusimicrobia bacterium]|nr:hypothetical protein [Elusimicrobiota bacterium]
RRGAYPIVPEREADGVIVGEMSRYILLPVQYDANLVPTAYKLIVIINFRFLDAKKNIYLWEENNLEGIQTYAASTLPGGMKEEEAREAIWDVMARDIATRTYEGFGSVSGASQRKILATDVAPSTAPAKSPAAR